jgi:hypothetical protein
MLVQTSDLTDGSRLWALGFKALVYSHATTLVCSALIETLIRQGFGERSTCTS